MAQGRSSSLGDVRRLFQPAPGEAPQADVDEAGTATHRVRRSASAQGSGAEPESSPVPQPRGKVRATFHVYEDTLDEAKNAVVALMGPPLFLTLSDLLDSALRDKVTELEKTYNNGQPFARRPSRLRGGRPLGS